LLEKIIIFENAGEVVKLKRAIEAVYDNGNIVFKEAVPFKGKSDVLVLFMEELKAESKNKKLNFDFKKYEGSGKGVWNIDANKYIKGLRNNDRQ